VISGPIIQRTCFNRRIGKKQLHHLGLTLVWLESSGSILSVSFLYTLPQLLDCNVNIENTDQLCVIHVEVATRMVAVSEVIQVVGVGNVLWGTENRTLWRRSMDWMGADLLSIMLEWLCPVCQVGTNLIQHHYFVSEPSTKNFQQCFGQMYRMRHWGQVVRGPRPYQSRWLSGGFDMLTDENGKRCSASTCSENRLRRHTQRSLK